MPNLDTYAIDIGDMRTLEKIRSRLYAPQPLSPDERRDLANTLDAILGKAIPFDSASITQA